MARVTIDDCTDKIESRFELVLFASHRARQALEGVTLQVEDTRAQKFEKTTVQALREIAEGDIAPEVLEESFIAKMQNERNLQKPVEEPVVTEESGQDTPQLEYPNIIASTPPLADSQMAHGVAFDDDVSDEDA